MAIRSVFQGATDKVTPTAQPVTTLLASDGHFVTSNDDPLWPIPAGTELTIPSKIQNGSQRCKHREPFSFETRIGLWRVGRSSAFLTSIELQVHACFKIDGMPGLFEFQR